MMKMHNFLFILLLFFVASCSDEVFKAKTTASDTKSSELETRSVTSQSTFTLIRPEVDLLFIWDNSTSTNFINSQTKTALNRVIDHISNRFDYHVMMAPLIGTGNNNSVFFSYQAMDPGSGIKVVSKEFASHEISLFPSASGSYEAGAQRARDLLRDNISNGVFRKNAYTLVIIMSNDDDKSYVTGDYDSVTLQRQYIDNRAYDLNCIRGHYNGTRPDGYTGPFGTECSGATKLDSLMMRFFSIVAIDRNLCASSGIYRYTLNGVYKGLSERIYLAPYTDGLSSPNDDLTSPFDSFDLCLENYSYIFDGVNSAITDTVIKHHYNFWPVAGSQDSVDPTTLSVVKSNGIVLSKIPDNIVITRDPDGKDDRDAYGNQISGYRYIGDRASQNTRYAPTSGEPFSGKMIELFGIAKVSWPEYITVTSSAEKEYLGYCQMNSEPEESTIVVKVNGNVIPAGGSDGWTLVKNSSGVPLYEQNKNIRIVSPTNFAEGSPAIRKTGYFVRLGSGAVYSNSISCNVEYLPAAK